MFDELYAADVESGLRDRSLRPLPRPEPPPGVGAGFWSAAAKAIPAAGVESFRAMSPVLDAYGKAAAYRDAPSIAMIHGKAVPGTKGAGLFDSPRYVHGDAAQPDDELLQRETINRIGDNDLGRELRPVVDRLTPDPATTGAAGQFVFGAGKVVGKAVGYSMLTGPVAGAALTGVDEGTNEAMRLMDKGVDPKTAAKAGAVHGLATGISVALPVAGKTIAQTASLAVVGGPASYMAETATIRHLLESADYDKLAREYDPFDTTGLLISMAAPSVMGAWAHVLRARTASGNRGVVRTAAERAGVSPDIAQMIASIETGGTFSATAANRKSTARGLYQFLDSTWRDYGGTEGNRFDATAQADIGARFIRDNIAGLTKALGRDPAPHEVYLAHLLGQKGAAHVLQADTGRPLADVVAEYDVKNAARIVAGNGMKDMSVGQAVEKWKKTADKHLPKGYRPDAPRAESTTPPIDAETEAATRVLLASMHARNTSLVPETDLGGMARHIDGIEDARARIDAGQPVDVGSRVGIEQGRLGDAYDRVLSSPAGDAFDPLVHIRPDDIGDTAPSFLHQTGQDQSVKSTIAQPQFSAIDRMRLGNGAFDITEALAKAGEIFNKLRASGKGIDSFFADPANLEGLTPETNNLMIALSENADNPQRMTELLARYADAAQKPGSAGASPGNLLADATESMRSDPEPRQRSMPESVEQRAAAQAIVDRPNLKIRLDDGSEIDAQKALMDADAEIAEANTNGQGFMAAVHCFLRH